MVSRNTKYQARVNRRERMVELSRRCFYIAKNESGPTQLNIPKDYFYLVKISVQSISRYFTGVQHHPGLSGRHVILSEFSFVHVKPRTVILTTIKKAEDSNALIFRVYESQGNNTKASLHFFKRPKTVTEVNLIEQNLKTVRFSGKTVRFPISHYQIKSFKVQF